MKIYRTLPLSTTLTSFLQREQAQPFTYNAIGQTADPALTVSGFDHDHQRVAIGAGPADFERAKTALAAWVHFPQAWTRILPANAPLQPGVTVVMLFRLFGLWWRNSCRIVYTVNEARRYGFAYGTLPGHLECGEEIFQVELDEAGTVWYELRAFSQPRHWLARLAYPLVRMLQEKFRQDSAVAMRQFVTGKTEPASTPDAWTLRVLAFVLAAAGLWPGRLMGHDYGRLPLIFAALLLVPAGLQLAARHFPALQPAWHSLLRWLLPAALALALALAFPPGWSAALLTLPWLGVCLGVAWSGLRFLLSTRQRSAAELAAGLGLVYLAVGGAWCFADRAGWQPLNFGADIVLLTALHFHYAGFALPLLTGIAARFAPGRLAHLAAWGVVLGVPLTALGITATQLGLAPWLETFAALFMALAGVLVGALWMVLGIRHRNGLLVVAGLVLGGSMLLALTYALRVVYPALALSLDWMRALHGSLNGFVALPLGLAGLWWLGWRHDEAV